MSKKYTVDYYIEKFKAISNSKWAAGTLDNGLGQFCALGHCGVKDEEDLNREGKALQDLFRTNLGPSVQHINDSGDTIFDEKGEGNNIVAKINQKKPKSRILAALKYIKKITTKEKEDRVLKLRALKPKKTNEIIPMIEEEQEELEEVTA